jgi:hypothetical protein
MFMCTWTLSHRSMGSDTKRLERIAQEYNQLLYLVRKSQGLKFVDTLQPVSALLLYFLAPAHF